MILSGPDCVPGHEQPTQERLVYAQEEENAKASRVGLWKDAKPVPPWEWRRR